jgi:hypothetical protein
VVSYLSVGHTLQQYRGLSSCRICGQLNGSKELTDETYCWPEGLAHYVADHDVRLPDDFVRHVQAGSRAAGEGSAPVLGHLGQRVRGGEYDERYDAWIDRWSKRARAGDISAGDDPNWLNAAIDDTWWTTFVRPAHGETPAVAQCTLDEWLST